MSEEKVESNNVSIETEEKKADVSVNVKSNPYLDGDQFSSDNVVASEETEEKKAEVLVKVESNPYAYLDRDEFSSERFKIVVKNLPKYYGFSEIKKLINDKLNLASNKIKVIRKNFPYVFITFRNDEDRDNAIRIINSFTWKGNLLVAKTAEAAPDPLVKKRNLENDERRSKKRKVVDDAPQEERLKNTTTPLWNVPYEEQLQIKQDSIKTILMQIGKDLWKQNPALRSYLDKQKALHNDLPCELLDIRHADDYNGYRNKCEFTVGIDEETKLPTVGMRLGSYVTGKTGVAPVTNLPHISDRMKIAAQTFQDFVCKSDLTVFDPENQTGNFRQLTVRTSSDQLMLVIGVHPQKLTIPEIATLKSELVEYFANGDGKVANVSSLFYQNIVKKQSNNDVLVMEHLHGDTHIQEKILDLSFRISPQAFFQINTNAANILYNSAIEMAQCSENSTVVDICCGTGTIGLCFAKSCNQVLGVELIPEAVEDAKVNAQLNGIENCEFFAGKAEEILSSVLYRVKNEDVIAIVDPPRAGLHQKCIVQLRKARKINKLVYVSCNPNAAMKNFTDLGRPISKTMFGEPFVPIRAVPVDMFPYTNHCELIIYFERWSQEKFDPAVSTAIETPADV